MGRNYGIATNRNAGIVRCQMLYHFRLGYVPDLDYQAEGQPPLLLAMVNKDVAVAKPAHLCTFGSRCHLLIHAQHDVAQ